MINHSFVSTKSNGSATDLLRPTDWNADHVVDASELRTTLSAPTTNKLCYVATWGSDSNDGRSWLNAKLTAAAGHALLTGNLGDLYFGPGVFDIPDTVILTQSQRWHGRHWHAGVSQGTEFQWTGLDDGRNMFEFSTGSGGSSKQLFENIRIRGVSGMTGGGSCLYLRQLQNGAIIRNVHITDWGAGPSFKLVDTIAGSVDYPGYLTLRDCWAATDSPYGFHIESGTTGILLENCASDARPEQLAPFYFTMKSETPVAITACSQSGNNATYTASGHGQLAGNIVHIKGVTPAGYNGMYKVASVSGTTFVLALNRTGLTAGSAFGTIERKRAGGRGMITMINCKAEAESTDAPCILSETSQQIIVIGLSDRGHLSSSAAPMVQWDGPKFDDAGNSMIVPPINLIGCHGQSRSKLLVADRFGPDNGTFEIINSAFGGGRSCQFNYMPAYTYTPVLDFVAMAAPPNPEVNNKRMFLNSATGKLSVVDSAGTVVSLEP